MMALQPTGAMLDLMQGVCLPFQAFLLLVAVCHLLVPAVMLLVISHFLIVRVLRSRLWVQLCTSMRTGRCTVLCLTTARAGGPLPLACITIYRDISLKLK